MLAAVLFSLPFRALTTQCSTCPNPSSSYHTDTGYGKASGPGRPSTLPLSANKAAGAAAIARAEGLGGWQAPSWLVDDSSDGDINELLKAAGRRRSKLRFVRRLFPGLSCFLPEEPKD